MTTFKFYSKQDLTLLLGLRASTPRQLLSGLRKVPDSSIYHHTHHFLQRHHFFTPEPSNDFSLWAQSGVNDRALAERLSSIDIVHFRSIAELRESLILVFESHVASSGDDRPVTAGLEFHFMSSQTYVFPTPYAANTIREFISALQHVSVSTLYHHMFDARLRLGRDENDFSAWFRSLGHEDLADDVRALDPYAYTLDNLRRRLLILLRPYDRT